MKKIVFFVLFFCIRRSYLFNHAIAAKLSCKPYVAGYRSHNYITVDLVNWSNGHKSTPSTLCFLFQCSRRSSIQKLIVRVTRAEYNVQKTVCKRNGRKIILRKQLAHLYSTTVSTFDNLSVWNASCQFDGHLNKNRMSIFSLVQNEGAFAEWIIIIIISILPTDSINLRNYDWSSLNANFDFFKLKSLRTCSPAR